MENVQGGIGDIKFYVIEPTIFKHNLILIDSGLPRIIDVLSQNICHKVDLK